MWQFNDKNPRGSDFSQLPVCSLITDIIPSLSSRHPVDSYDESTKSRVYGSQPLCKKHSLQDLDYLKSHPITLLRNDFQALSDVQKIMPGSII